MLKNLRIGTRLALMGAVALLIPLPVVGYLSISRASAALAKAPVIVSAAKAVPGDSTGQRSISAASSLLSDLNADSAVGSEYEVIVLLGRDATVISASKLGYAGVNVSERDYVKAALEGRINIGSPNLNKVSGNPFVPVAAPVADASGNITGALAAVMRLDFLTSLISNTPGLVSPGMPSSSTGAVLRSHTR